MRPTKNQINMRIHTVWSESAWWIFASLANRNAPSEDLDQAAQMRRLI